MRRLLTASITSLLVVAASLAAGPSPARAGGAVEIVVLGGTGAIGDPVLEHLRSCTAGPVRRVSGDDRFATAAAVSADTFPTSDVVYVATSGDFPDAVAAGSPAAIAGAPVLLTRPGSLPGATYSEIERLGATRVFVLGGGGAVSSKVASALERFGTVTRLSGPNRFATAAAISRQAFSSADTVYVATGTDFPDALAGAPAAAFDGAPILLVTRDTIPAPTQSELDRLDPSTTVVLGGSGVISDAVAAQLPGTVVRLGGSNRFATAAAISEATFTPGDTPVIYVTTGLTSPDALAGGPAAGYRGGPILLAARGALPAETAAEIARLTGDPCTAFQEPVSGYRIGLEPGSVLGGHVLPIDWSKRHAPCGASETDRVAGALCPGDASAAVSDLQRMLRDRKLYRGPITGVFDEATVFAVIAFHKLVGPAHSDPATARLEWLGDPPPDDWNAADWDMLAAFQPRPPKARDGQPNRVEVDIGHQVLYLIAAGQVDAIIPVSTGSGTGTRGCTRIGCGAYVTPRTDMIDGGGVFYTQHDFAGGWSPRPGDWSIYKAIFYHGNYGEWNYGIHGYPQVPAYPDSHGCIRVSVWDMDYLRPDDGSYRPEGYEDPSRVWLGMTINVWDE